MGETILQLIAYIVAIMFLYPWLGLLVLWIITFGWNALVLSLVAKISWMQGIKTLLKKRFFKFVGVRFLENLGTLWAMTVVWGVADENQEASMCLFYAISIGIRILIAFINKNRMLSGSEVDPTKKNWLALGTAFLSFPMLFLIFLFVMETFL